MSLENDLKAFANGPLAAAHPSHPTSQHINNNHHHQHHHHLEGSSSSGSTASSLQKPVIVDNHHHSSSSSSNRMASSRPPRDRSPAVSSVEKAKLTAQEAAHAAQRHLMRSQDLQSALAANPDSIDEFAKLLKHELHHAMSHIIDSTLARFLRERNAAAAAAAASLGGVGGPASHMAALQAREMLQRARAAGHLHHHPLGGDGMDTKPPPSSSSSVPINFASPLLPPNSSSNSSSSFPGRVRSPRPPKVGQSDRKPLSSTLHGGFPVNPLHSQHLQQQQQHLASLQQQHHHHHSLPLRDHALERDAAGKERHSLEAAAAAALMMKPPLPHHNPHINPFLENALNSLHHNNNNTNSNNNNNPSAKQSQNQSNRDSAGSAQSLLQQHQQQQQQQPERNPSSGSAGAFADSDHEVPVNASPPHPASAHSAAQNFSHPQQQQQQQQHSSLAESAAAAAASRQASQDLALQQPLFPSNSSSNGFGGNRGGLSSPPTSSAAAAAAAAMMFGGENSLPGGDMEQTEPMSLVVAPKKKRTKVTDTRLSPRAAKALLAEAPTEALEKPNLLPPHLGGGIVGVSVGGSSSTTGILNLSTSSSIGDNDNNSRPQSPDEKPLSATSTTPTPLRLTPPLHQRNGSSGSNAGGIPIHQNGPSSSSSASSTSLFPTPSAIIMPPPPPHSSMAPTSMAEAMARDPMREVAAARNAMQAMAEAHAARVAAQSAAAAAAAASMVPPPPPPPPHSQHGSDLPSPHQHNPFPSPHHGGSGGSSNGPSGPGGPPHAPPPHNPFLPTSMPNPNLHSPDLLAFYTQVKISERRQRVFVIK